MDRESSVRNVDPSVDHQVGMDHVDNSPLCLDGRNLNAGLVILGQEVVDAVVQDLKLALLLVEQQSLLINDLLQLQIVLNICSQVSLVQTIHQSFGICISGGSVCSDSWLLRLVLLLLVI